MVEIDTIRAAMQHVCWYPGDEISDNYLELLDIVTDPKFGDKSIDKAKRRLDTLKRERAFIVSQLVRYEFPPTIEGLVGTYDYVLYQVETILYDTAGQQG